MVKADADTAVMDAAKKTKTDAAKSDYEYHGEDKLRLVFTRRSDGRVFTVEMSHMVDRGPALHPDLKDVLRK